VSSRWIKSLVDGILSGGIISQIFVSKFVESAPYTVQILVLLLLINKVGNPSYQFFCLKISRNSDGVVEK